MNDLDQAIAYHERKVKALKSAMPCDGCPIDECSEEHRQIAEWLRELKAYREDTRFADLYERICIKRDEDRKYFARTKDKTYITRIAEKEVFIHMMQDMMFDRYGVDEVNADGEGSDSE